MGGRHETEDDCWEDWRSLLRSPGRPWPHDTVKIGFITKFPVPFFATMEDAAKAYAAANPGVEIIFGQGTSATDIEGQIALIESMVTQGVQGIASRRSIRPWRRRSTRRSRPASRSS